ncbi:MAG TPA: aminotransferase class I/II-fold pyridoxal phosphate-dependent enzyme [Micromonosporaceae bacterium]|nr:aminotransferase class I/II-fold pyridoxal phosphate-dependent enzyme [Micromonosporaceae bacterium]
MAVRYQPATYQASGGTANEIAAGVEAGLRSGTLANGDSLPPVRTLARELRVSPATVAAAYQALRRRGVVETAGRNGTRIRMRPTVAGDRSVRRLAVPAGVLDLSSGEPDARLLPRLSAALASVAAADTAGYAAGGPLPELETLARDAFAADGIDVASASFGVTGGALDGIERVLAAHLRAGDRVAVEDPGWANLLDLVAALGLHPLPVPVDQDGPLPDGLRAALAAGARAVVVTSRAHNPTGATVTAERAAALRGVLGDHPQTLVVEDDHAAQLSVQPLHALAGATPSWAFIRSVSKPYGPDLRVALVAADETTMARVRGRQSVGTGWVSTVLQRIVLALATDPAVTSLIADARDSYERRRTALVDALVVRGLAAVGRSGINVWLALPRAADETATVARLRDDGYAVAPGALYRLASAPGVRITVSNLNIDGVEALADAVLRAVAGRPARPAA